MLKGNVCRGVVQKGKSSCSTVLINLGSNCFVDAKKVKSNFDLLKLKHTKTEDIRIIPLILERNDSSFEHINYGMVEPYFDNKQTFKPISLRKVKKLR